VPSLGGVGVCVCVSVCVSGPGARPAGGVLALSVCMALCRRDGCAWVCTMGGWASSRGGSVVRLH
jgi:hypothetical protein